MKFYRINNFFSDANESSYWDSSLTVEYNGDYYNLGDIEFEELYFIAKEKSADSEDKLSLKSYVISLIKSGQISKWPLSNIDKLLNSIQSPIFPQEVWAAGVTYSDSMRERQAESDSPDVYAKVYNAERPEIFFKGTGDRMQPPESDLGIRSDSGWDVPESELAVIIINGEIVGFTIGNDMSSRSIEGENPLYLPQAKVYNKSFSIGPCIILSEDVNPQDLRVELKILRKGEIVFDGNSSTAEMKRNVIELVDWLQRSNDLPEVAVLLTGTGIIPPQDFTLEPNDVVEIFIEKIGTLRNKISLV
tara:strand:+ start:3046 stop:3957 length:912 start_codon:yes stop_codon:yes gene_type:complete